MFMKEKKEDFTPSIVDPFSVVDAEAARVRRSIFKMSSLGSFCSAGILFFSFFHTLGVSNVFSLLGGVGVGASVVGGIFGIVKMNYKREEHFHKTSYATSLQIRHRVDELIDGKFVVSSKTNHFDSIIQGRLSQSSIGLDSFDTYAINQFLYLLNVNYYPCVLKHFPTMYREDMIIETVDQLFTYLVQNEKKHFGEKELKQFFQGYSLLSKKEKKNFLKEFQSGRYKNSYYKRNQYAIFPKKMDEDVRPIIPMFQIKEEKDSHQLDLGIVLDIQQRVSRLPVDAQEKYNAWLHKTVFENKKNSSESSMELRAQLCRLFAEVEFEPKEIISPKIYREYFRQFSFFANSQEFDSFFEKGMGQFYSMIQFLEVHKSNIDSLEYLELQGVATEIFYQLLIHQENYTTDILKNMPNNYKKSVSSFIENRFDMLLQKKEFSKDSIVQRSSDTPVDYYIAQGIKVLREKDSLLEEVNSKKVLL